MYDIIFLYVLYTIIVTETLFIGIFPYIHSWSSGPKKRVILFLHLKGFYFFLFNHCLLCGRAVFRGAVGPEPRVCHHQTVG